MHPTFGLSTTVERLRMLNINWNELIQLLWHNSAVTLTQCCSSSSWWQLQFTLINFHINEGRQIQLLDCRPPTCSTVTAAPLDTYDVWKVAAMSAITATSVLIFRFIRPVTQPYSPHIINNVHSLQRSCRDWHTSANTLKHQIFTPACTVY